MYMNFCEVVLFFYLVWIDLTSLWETFEYEFNEWIWFKKKFKFRWENEEFLNGIYKI